MFVLFLGCWPFHRILVPAPTVTTRWELTAHVIAHHFFEVQRAIVVHVEIQEKLFHYLESS